MSFKNIKIQHKSCYILKNVLNLITKKKELFALFYVRISPFVTIILKKGFLKK